jgi:hypothetical protein
MKKNNFLMACLLVMATSCVDDFTDANQPRQLDAPAIAISATTTDNLLVQPVPVNPFQNNFEAFVGYGSSAQFTISVLDAPGKVNSVSVVPSIPEYGTVAIDEASVNALKGTEKGNFKFTFTPNAALVGTADRAFNLVITVTDSQADTRTGESAPVTTSITVPTTLAKGCFAQGIVAATYRVTAASGNLDGAVPFTLEDIEDDNGGPMLVTVTKRRAGRYTFNEITGGVWPLYYSGRANPALDVNLCGSSIVGHEGAVTAGAGTATARKFTITGALNSNGTITINWSYERVTGATPANSAKGTYTLSKL